MFIVDRFCLQVSVKLEPSSADTLECVAVEIPRFMRKGVLPFCSYSVLLL